MVVLLTIHRRYGPVPLARALAEYTVVALLAGLLAAGGGIDQQPADQATPSSAATPKAEATAGEDRPAVIQVAAKVVRAITGAVGWLVELWHQADRNTAPTKGQAMTASARSPAPSVLLLWRSP